MTARAQRVITLQPETTRRITFELVPLVVPLAFEVSAEFASGYDASSYVVVERTFGDHDPANLRPLPHASVVGFVLTNESKKAVNVSVVLLFDVGEVKP